MLFYDEKDLLTVPLAGGEVTQLTTTEEAWERDGVFSPDGRYIAYSSYDNDEWTVYVTPCPELAPRTTVSGDAGGIGPQWSTDGSEIFFIQGSKMMVADVLYDPSISVGTRTELFDGGFWVDPSGDQFYSVGRDGRFLMVRGEDPVELRVITGLRGGADPGGG